MLLSPICTISAYLFLTSLVTNLDQSQEHVMSVAAEVSKTSYFALFMALKSFRRVVPRPIPQSYPPLSPFDRSYSFKLLKNSCDSNETQLEFKVCHENYFLSEELSFYMAVHKFNAVVLLYSSIGIL